MRRYIAIGMADQAQFTRPVQPGEIQLSTRTELVYVYPDAYTQHRKRQLAWDSQLALALS